MANINANNSNGAYNHFKKSGMPLMYYAPNGSTATLLIRNNNYAIIITNSNGSTTSFIPQLTNSTNQTNQTNNDVIPTIPQEIMNTTFYDTNGNRATVFLANNGQYIIQINNIDGTQLMYAPNIQPNNNGSSTTSGTGTYTPSSGVPANITPFNYDNRYILKTQIVPPVCPRCPSICNSNPSQQNPPCPSCGNPGSGSNSGYTTIANTTNANTSNANTSNTNTSNANTTNANNQQSNTNSLISPNNGYNPAANNTDRYSKYRTNSQFEPVPVTADFSTF